MKKLFLIMAAAIMCTILLTGCTNDDVYNSANAYREKVVDSAMDLANGTQEAVESIDIKEIGNEVGTTVKNAANTAAAKSTTAVGLGLNKACPVIIVTSLVIGIILWLIANKASAIKLKQTAIGLFIIAIPFIMILLTYGMAFLSSWFS